MSQQSQELWKTYKGETYCYFSDCPFDVKPKVSDENRMPVDGKSCDYQGFHYVTRKVEGKNGKNAWWKVVKIPLGQQPQGNGYDARQDQIQKNFEERLNFDKERLSFDKNFKAALEANTESNKQLIQTILTLAAQNAATFEQLEILTRTLVDRADLFKTADKLVSPEMPNITTEVSSG